MGNTLFVINLNFENTKSWKIAKTAVYIEAITKVGGEEEVVFPSST